MKKFHRVDRQSVAMRNQTAPRSRVNGGRLSHSPSAIQPRQEPGATRQIRIGMTTYLKPSYSGLVISAELLASCRDTVTMSWPMLASTSIR